MAITADKLLNRPSELHRRYGGRLAMQKSLQEKMVGGGPTNIVLTKKSVKNIEIIKTKVIEIEGILKGTLASEKKALDKKKRQESEKRRQKKEEKLETRPNAEKGLVKMPLEPRLGIFDWIKNFIGNVILGYFAVRLIAHLPKIIPILKFIGKATDFVIDVGGKLLNGLATFVDWGYKAYDASRGFLKSFGGEDFAKGFDKFIGALDTAVFLTTFIAGDLLLEYLSGERDRGPGKPARGGRPKVTTSGGRELGRPDIRSPFRQKPTVTTGQGGKPGGFRLPGTGPKVTGTGGPKIKVPKGIKARGGLLGLVFLIPDLIDAGMLVSQGRGKDGLRALLSAVSGVVAGMAAYSATLAGAAALGITGVGIPAAIGLAVAGLAASAAAGTAAYNLADAGLKKMGLYDKDPKTGNPYSYRSGGVTRGGKTQGRVKRKVSSLSKGKYKRKIIPQKPGDIEIKPGSDIGGEDKILGIFPNPLKVAKKAVDFVNPFKVVKSAGEELGKTDYFGPILSITSKITLGQKPSQRDYENVGLGINMLIFKGMQERQLKGGIVAAFAEGGLVDPDVLSAVETGGDISNWVAKTFQGEIESNAQKTLRMIRENSKKKKITTEGEEGVRPSSPDSYESGPAGSSGDALTMARNLMRDLGLTEAQASGIVGNMIAESGVENARPQGSTPGTKGPLVVDGMTGYGIVQWTSKGRQQALYNFAKSMGHDMSKPLSMDIEYKFFLKELRESYGSVLSQIKNANDVKTASTIFMQQYEIPAGYKTESKIMERYNLSKPVFDKLKSGQGVATKGTDSYVLPTGVATSAVTGSMKERQNIAGELGDFIKSLGVAKGSGVHEHPRHGGVKGYHRGRGHYEGRAIDIGGWGGKYGRAKLGKNFVDDQSAILAAINRFAAKTGKKPSLVLHGDNDAGHWDHVHAEYEMGGETLPYPHLAMLGERGMEIVIDNDSSVKKATPMLLAINDAKDERGVMKAIQQYAPYDALSPQIIIIPTSDENIGENQYDAEESSSGMISMFGGDNYDPFETLYQGT